MGASRIALVGSCVGVLLGAPALARADEEIVAGGGFRFLTPDVTIDQGEPLVFRNTEVVEHDVVSVQPGPVRGSYLFASDVIGQGETSFVEGSQYLTSGAYDFICSLHPEQMKGRLTVTGKGKPAERPASGGSGGGAGDGDGGSDPAAEDITGPLLSLAVGSTEARTLRRTRALRVRVSSDEAAAIRVTVRVSGRRVGRAAVRLGSAGTRRLSIRLDRRARAALRRGRQLRVTATALDPAGNPGTARLIDRLR